jgi:transposase
MHPVCCGLDVHKETLSACLVITDENGNTNTEIREFGTFTEDLIKLREWLLENECPILVMESTGVYWRPVHNVLEGYCKVMLANPYHAKNLPGRKTDICDSMWLAGLLRNGLIKASFIPDRQTRQWRDLTRLRKTYVETVSDYKRRVHKLFESANIKIDSVVSDLFGATGRNLMTLLAKNASPLSLEQVEDCLRGTLRKKAHELFCAVQGFFTDHHRYVLSSLQQIIATIEGQIEQIDNRLRMVMISEQPLLERMVQVPGISEVSGRALLSELGPTLDSFQTPGALCVWAGVCPGNNETAKKRRSGKIPVRKHHVKTILTEAAWAAIKVKGSYYQDKYLRLKFRRGAKKAIIAIAHRMLKALYFIIKEGQNYKELGQERVQKNAKLSRLKRQARLLGHALVPISSEERSIRN